MVRRYYWTGKGRCKKKMLNKCETFFVATFCVPYSLQKSGTGSNDEYETHSLAKSCNKVWFPGAERQSNLFQAVHKIRTLFWTIIYIRHEKRSNPMEIRVITRVWITFHKLSTAS